MIRVELREAIEAYQAKHGVKLTYQQIAEQTSLGLATLQSLAARPDYNTRLSTIDKLCGFLGCEPSDLLVYIADENGH